jgi:hypothetical protein
LFQLRKTTDSAFHKHFDEPLAQKSFCLVALYVALEDDPSRSSLTPAETKDFIKKAHLNIPLHDYAHFKYSPHYPLFRTRVTAYESIGDPEKAQVKQLNEALEKFDHQLMDHKYFAGDTTYANIETDLRTSYLAGDMDKTREIAEEVDLRRIPL